MDSQPSQNAQPEVLSPASVFTPQMLVIASASFAVLLLAIIAIASRRRASSHGDSVLLVGPLDAGKTAILSTFIYRQTLPTHTSMQTNTSDVLLPKSNKVVRMVDIPGHPRIRDQFKEHMPNAKAIVFVVDTSTISRNGAAVAEHLHQIMHALTSYPPSQTPPPLLIVAHKCDLLKPTAQASPGQLAINRVTSILERELEKRRATHASGVNVESMGAEDAESEMGGLECTGNGEFRFANWEGGEVSLVGTSLHVSKAALTVNEKSEVDDGLSPLANWLLELP